MEVGGRGEVGGEVGGLTFAQLLCSRRLGFYFYFYFLFFFFVFIFVFVFFSEFSRCFDATQLHLRIHSEKEKERNLPGCQNGIWSYGAR